MPTQKLAILLALILSGKICLIAQESNFPLQLTIEDTLLVKGENEDAVRVHINLEKLKPFEERILLLYFNKNISIGLSDTIKVHESLGLAYFIQDSLNNFIRTIPMALASYGTPEFADRVYRTVANEQTLKFEKLILNDSALHSFHIAELTLPASNTSNEMVVYPLLEEDYNLSAGIYYLTLLYNFKEFPFYYTEDDFKKFEGENIFKGVLKSNTVKLIVKEPPKKSKRKRR